MDMGSRVYLSTPEPTLSHTDTESGRYRASSRGTRRVLAMS
jgi:hypothetical protein